MQRLGRWELREVLGSGAHGVVWKAWDPTLGRHVALKVLRAGPSATFVAHERLRREAQALARLRHPNVVLVHETGSHEGAPFVVMELVPGKTFAQLIREKAPRERLLGILEETARGLAAMHEVGVIHRDLKPANVLVDDERARIADFGIVRVDDASVALTETKAVLGTPLYLAPEAAFPGLGAVGPATDVFALGCILHEILAGTPPLSKAETLDDLFAALARKTSFAPPSAVDRSARPFDELCARALEKDPKQRLASASEFADLLVAARAGRGARASQRGVALAVAAAALVVAVFFLPRDPAALPVPSPPEKKDPPRDGPPPPGKPKVPSWYSRLRWKPPRLPDGVRFGDAPGEYVNEADGTILIWVPGEPPFFAGKLETTIEQFARFVRETSWDASSEAWLAEPIEPSPEASWREPHAPRARPLEREPVTQVSWHDAKAYAKWAKLRVPSVLEWRRTMNVDPGTGTPRRFPWGDEARPGAANIRDRSYARVLLGNDPGGVDDGFARAAPVGSFPQGASLVGALDTEGNVAEICEPDEAEGDPRYVDAFHGDRSTRQKLPSGRFRCALHDAELARRLGSAWTTEYARNIARECCDSAREDLGFRLVRDP